LSIQAQFLSINSRLGRALGAAIGRNNIRAVRQILITAVNEIANTILHILCGIDYRPKLI